jgi:hypothetical protein
MSGVFLATAYACLLLLLMRRLRFFSAAPGLPWAWLAGLFVLKILAGTALWWIYTHLYTDRHTADIFKYFDDSAVLFSALPDKPGDYLRMITGLGTDTDHYRDTYFMRMNNWFRQYESGVYNDAHTVIRFNALVRLISFGEFHVHTVVSAFLSLTGLVGIYRAFVGFLPGLERALMAAVFLLPSVLLWASGVLKESLLFLGLGLVLYQVFRLFDRRYSPTGILALLAALYLLLHLKFYVLLSLLPALLLYGWTRGRPAWGLLWKAVVLYGGGLLLVVNLHHLLPGADVLGLIALKQKDFIGLAVNTGSGSFVMPPLLTGSLPSFLENAPYAVYITLFGPMVHFSGPLGLISAVENALLVGLVALMLVYTKPWRQVDRPLVVSLLAYMVVLALVIGWTTPVMGAIVRYRTPLLPFLPIIALLLFDRQRFLGRWPAAARNSRT